MISKLTGVSFSNLLAEPRFLLTFETLDSIVLLQDFIMVGFFLSQCGSLLCVVALDESSPRTLSLSFSRGPHGGNVPQIPPPVTGASPRGFRFDLPRTLNSSHTFIYVEPPQKVNLTPKNSAKKPVNKSWPACSMWCSLAPVLQFAPPCSLIFFGLGARASKPVIVLNKSTSRRPERADAFRGS